MRERTRPGLTKKGRAVDIERLQSDVEWALQNGLGPRDLVPMLERLRQNPTTADIPVLLMTTEAEDRLIERAKKAGAKGWFIKPVKPEMLLMATNKLAR